MLARTGAFLALALASLSASLATGPAWGDERPPNIVVFFADDLGYGDLGSYGHPNIRTPNLDALAAEGQRWTDFYVAAPVCSPSRGALLTGRLPNRTGLYGKQIAVLFDNDTTGIPHEEITLAEALGEVGYHSGIIGKWHLGDAPDYYPTRHGFKYWYGLPYSNDMMWVDEPGIDEIILLNMAGQSEKVRQMLAGRQAKYAEPKNRYWSPPLVMSRVVDGEASDVIIPKINQSNLTNNHTYQAVEFIKGHVDLPFFLYVPYSMPHTPLFRSEAFEGKSLGGLYGDVIEELDWSVGEIVSTLKRLNLAENTLVIFTSDNGPWLTMNQHGGTAGLLNNGKGTTFEGGMRVPAIFWWPGRIQPAVVSDIGSALDIMPTVLNLANTSVDVHFDGYDLTDTLTQGAPSPRKEMAYYRSGELRAYRYGDYKLHLVTEGAYGQPPQRTVHEQPVLHNLRDDPSERFDISASYPAVVEDIKIRIARHKAGLKEKPPIFDERIARLAAKAQAPASQ